MTNILPRWYEFTQNANLKHSKNDVDIIEHALFMVEIDDLVKYEELKMFNEANF